MNKAILEITDGTPVNTVDLLSPRFGYILCDWRPARPPLEFVQNRNQFTGIQTPAVVVQGETVESMTFNARHSNTDELILDEQRLNRVLKMASLYWTKDRAVTRPFYIRAKNKKETGIRYAAIFSAQMHDDSNPYAAPFFQRKPASQNLVVPLSRGDWLDHIPGAGGLNMLENVSSTLSGSLAFKNRGTWLLNDDARIFLTNSLTHAALTDIFAGANPQNLLGLPEFDGFNLFDTSVAGEFTYFGLHVNPSNPYLSKKGWQGIWFNITTPSSLSAGTFKWEIYLETNIDFYEWLEVEVTDGTDGFTVPGTVLFNDFNYNWGNTTINNTPGQWCRVSHDGSMTQIPAVTIRYPAAVGLPHFDILLASDEAQPPLVPPDFEEILPPALLAINWMMPGFDVFQGGTDEEVHWMHFDASPSFGAVSTYSWAIRESPSKVHYVQGEQVHILFQNQGIFEVHLTLHDFYEPDNVGLRKSMSMYSHWYTWGETWKVALDFTVTNPQPDVGVQISFDSARSTIDIPADSIASSRWRFGTGDQDDIVTAGPTIPIGSHIYTEAGLYSIGLEVTFTGGRTASVYKFGHVLVSHTVTASFEANQRRGFAPFKPKFNASESSSTGGVITSYDWDFGDGTTGTGVTPDKVYTVQGIYNVSLTVTDSLAETDTLTYTSYIYVDNTLLYPGDNGIYLKFGINPSVPSWGLDTPNRVYIGARPIIVSEDYYFQGFIPVYGDDVSAAPGWNQPTAIAWINTTGGNIVEQGTAYTGYVIEHTYSSGNIPVTPGDEVIFASIRFRNRSYKRYKGVYRIFLRVSSASEINRGDIYWSAGVSPDPIPGVNTSTGLNRTRRVTDAIHSSYITTLDLGSVTLGGKEAVIQHLDIFWQPFMSHADQRIWLYDVVLIPQDKWFAEVSFPFYDFDFGQGYELSISSLTPSGELETQINKIPQNWLEHIPSSIPNLPLSFIGKDVRFTMLSVRHDSREPQFTPLIPVMHSRFNYNFELSVVEKVNRYSSFRGKR